MKIKPINLSIILKKDEKIRLVESDISRIRSRIEDTETFIAKCQSALETGVLPLYYSSFPKNNVWDCVRKDIADYTSFIARWEESMKHSEESLQKYKDKVAKYERMVTDAINDVQAKCRVRKITTKDIIKAIRDIENHLRLPIKKMNGVHAWINPNYQSFKRAYNGIPESTHFGLTYKNGCWYMDRICRTICRNQYIALTLPDEAKRYLIERIENGK